MSPAVRVVAPARWLLARFAVRRLPLERPNPTRVIMAWLFGPPYASHMNLSAALDFGAARTYLDGLAARGTPVSVTALLCAAVARVLAEHPLANASLAGRAVLRREEVSLGVPVDLTGQPGAHLGELAATLLRHAERRSLLELSRELAGQVEQERRGQVGNPLTRAVYQAAMRLPPGAIWLALDLLDQLHRSPLGAELLYRVFPVTAVVTNPGGAFRELRGGWLRGAAVAVPHRVADVATVWGFGPVQDEVVAVEGRPEVRPLLPVLLTFDHRLVDGVLAGRLLQRFGELLQDPAAAFGVDGRAPAPHPG